MLQENPPPQSVYQSLKWMETLKWVQNSLEMSLDIPYGAFQLKTMYGMDGAIF
jgi:hypothetical protein